jgi:hypothetical protein
MTITLNKDTLALFFIQVTADTNWLASVSRTPEGHGYVLYRFRYHDSGALEIGDRKNWYEIKSTEPPAVALQKTTQVANAMANMWKRTLHSIVREHGDAEEDFGRWLLQQGFAWKFEPAGYEHDGNGNANA